MKEQAFVGHRPYPSEVLETILKENLGKILAIYFFLIHTFSYTCSGAIWCNEIVEREDYMLSSNLLLYFTLLQINKLNNIIFEQQMFLLCIICK